MVAALSKSNDPQVQAASQWLVSKTAAEVQKRHSDTIEAAIAKAKASGEHETVEASDGAGAYARVIAWAVNASGGFNLLRGITVNFLREFWRKKPTPESSSVLDKLVDPHSDLSKLWDEQHDRHVLHSLLELVEMEFTDTTWRAFRRLVLDGVPARTVAAELEITVNAVIIAKSRVLARLRQEAGGWLD